ncbi:MAG TPA: hypothetical protein VMD47_01165 [Candidatus Acidoferrales bacterium]|nr:hypothetical protein [Candidatus Acidoferrales bacterium]
MRTSEEFHVTRWLVAGSHVEERLLQAASGMPRLFSVDGAIHGLRLDARSRTSSRALEFFWTARERGLLPPLHGSVVLRRFGPALALTLRATYAFGDDPAAELAHLSAGRKLAHRGLNSVLLALSTLIRRTSENAQVIR